MFDAILIWLHETKEKSGDSGKMIDSLVTLFRTNHFDKWKKKWRVMGLLINEN